MIASRLLDFRSREAGTGRFDIESVSHMFVGRVLRNLFLPTDPSARRSSIATRVCCRGHA